MLALLDMMAATYHSATSCVTNMHMVGFLVNKIFLVGMPQLYGFQIYYFDQKDEKTNIDI